MTASASLANSAGMGEDAPKVDRQISKAAPEKCLRSSSASSGWFQLAHKMRIMLSPVFMAHALPHLCGRSGQAFKSRLGLRGRTPALMLRQTVGYVVVIGLRAAEDVVG